METVYKNPFKARKLGQLLVKFSAPAVAGMFVNALYNIASRIFIGNEVGSLGIAGISILFPMGLIFIAFSMLIGVGSNALFSIRLGEKRDEDAQLILCNAFVYLTIISAIEITVTYLFLDEILTFMGATPEIMPYALAYARPILFGYFFFIIALGLNNFIRSSGHPKTAMATQIIGACINIIFAPLFIFKFGWGMKGAAWAVVIGQIVSFIWIMAFFTGKRATYKISWKHLNARFDIFKDSVIVGLAQFIFQIASGTLNIILNHALIKYGGNIAVSAMGIVIAVNTIVIMPMIGISQGAQPLIGYNYGAKKYATSIQTLKMAIRWGTVLSVTGFIIIQIFARQIVSMFNSTDQNLISLSAKALRIFHLMLPLTAIPILATSFFQAINKPLKAGILSLSRQVLLLLPMVMILPLFFGLDGVFYAPPAADFMSVLLASYLLNKYFAKHKQNFFFRRKKF